MTGRATSERARTRRWDFTLANLADRGPEINKLENLLLNESIIEF
jgi:hypothetical protein